MTWREGYGNWNEIQPKLNPRAAYTVREIMYLEREAFLAGAKWAAGDLIDNAVWESRDIVYEFQKRLEEE